MATKFALSSRLISDPFWESVLGYAEDHEPQRAVLTTRLAALEALRAQAAYNTGSITFTAAWCLYALTRHVQARRVMEVGTFIGKSTISMASAMDDGGAPGEIITCDASNHLTLPWEGATQIRQFPGATSTQMLGQLEGTFDFLFLDGRLAREDLPLVDKLTTAETIVALDDFEGMEKGVANAMALNTMPKYRNHVLIYPPTQHLLARHGLKNFSLTAVLMPASAITFTRQG